MSHHHHHHHQEQRIIREEERIINNELAHLRREEHRHHEQEHHRHEEQQIRREEHIFREVARAEANLIQSVQSSSSEPWAHGTRIAFYNLAHSHYIAGHSNGEVTCHRGQLGEGTSFVIERADGDHVFIRSEASNGYLVAHDGGSFKCNGHKGHSHWHFERQLDGGVTLKAHNVSWYLGISILGNPEPIESHSYDRSHFRIEVLDAAAQSFAAAAPAAIPQHHHHGAANSEWRHGTKINLFNLSHKHYLAGHSDGSLTCHRSGISEDTRFHIENEDGGEGVFIRSSVAGYLVAHEGGSYKCNGQKGHTRWHLERTMDGGVTLKASNVAWYLGISMFGHLEAISQQSYDRAHWRVELAF